MKKFITFLWLSTSLTLTLAGCGSKEVVNSNQATRQEKDKLKSLQIDAFKKQQDLLDLQTEYNDITKQIESEHPGYVVGPGGQLSPKTQPQVPAPSIPAPPITK